jgi:DNA-binding transcriptional MerR regulator
MPAVSHPAAPRPAQTTYTIADLAAEYEVTPRAIRFYEDMGLVTPTRSGRNRVYSQRDRTRLKLTLRGKRLGLSLHEIKQLVDMYDSPSDTRQQLTAFLAVLSEHRQLLERQREDIETTLAEIAQHEARCRALLAGGAARTRRGGGLAGPGCAHLERGPAALGPPGSRVMGASTPWARVAAGESPCPR